MLAADLSIPVQALRGPTTVQRLLGARLLAFWDAERSDTLTLAGASVTGWADLVTGCVVAPPSTAARPVWSATSFAGRPGVSFDGIDDWLVAPTAPVPGGGNGCELWVVARQDAPPADATDRYLFSLGESSSVNRQIRVARSVVGGINRAAARVGDGTTNEIVVTSARDFSGAHVVRACFGPGTRVSIDGEPAAAVGRGPAGLGTSIAIGATVAGSSAINGVINAALVTLTLGNVDAAQLLSYLQLRARPA